jgi:FkbM family methyltransferase
MRIAGAAVNGSVTGLAESTFLAALTEALRSPRFGPWFTRNVDPLRYPALRPPRLAWWRLWLHGLLARAGYRMGWIWVTRGEWLQIGTRWQNVLAKWEGFERTYQLLADSYSRACLADVMALRIVGPRWFQLPRNTPQYWRDVRRTEALCRTRRGDSINDYDLAKVGQAVQFEANPMHLANTFVVEQYRYGDKVAAGPGDVVIDGGGCWGDTALYFALKVGPQGKVYCFELDPANTTLLQKNVARNPDLAPRIVTRTEALWDRSGQELRFSPGGTATSVARDTDSATDGRAQTLSVDDLVTAENLNRVDFIKLDIEGAELPALQGAVQTLRKFRPKLAVSLYHSLDDFVRIPQFLAGLDLGYEFFLDHFTVHDEETILFARPRT